MRYEFMVCHRVLEFLGPLFIFIQVSLAKNFERQTVNDDNSVLLPRQMWVIG